MTAAEIRRRFLDYFRQHGHALRRSAARRRSAFALLDWSVESEIGFADLISSPG